MVLLSKVPLNLYLKSLKHVMFLVMFRFILQLLFNKEGTPINDFYIHFGVFNIVFAIEVFLIYLITKKYIKSKLMYLILTLVIMFILLLFKPIFGMELFNKANIVIYSKGIATAIFITVRLIVLILFSTLLTLTTKPTDINNGLAAILSPLEKIGIKSSILAMMVSLALRYIPTLFNETDKILKAQASRGVDFNEGSLKEKLGQIVSLLIPMFVISFKRADELADAMEARGYVPGEKRVQLVQLKLKGADYIYLFVSILILAGIITVRAVGI